MESQESPNIPFTILRTRFPVGTKNFVKMMIFISVTFHVLTCETESFRVICFHENLQLGAQKKKKEDNNN